VGTGCSSGAGLQHRAVDLSAHHSIESRGWRREVVLMRWGLIPAKTADPDAFKIFSTTNARAETILEKPIWKEPFQHSRCLVPVSGFYEWVRPESRPEAVGL
jgi:putative SOS response-associated peptidase YedK